MFPHTLLDSLAVVTAASAFVNLLVERGVEADGGAWVGKLVDPLEHVVSDNDIRDA